MEAAYVFLDLELQITEKWNLFKREECVVKQSRKLLAKRKKKERKEKGFKSSLICFGLKSILSEQLTSWQ